MQIAIRGFGWVTYNEAYSETTKSVTHGTTKETKVRERNPFMKIKREERKQREQSHANLIQLLFL